jgi:RNA polymerase sigma-70 factor, ECF subfamily
MPESTLLYPDLTLVELIMGGDPRGLHYLYQATSAKLLNLAVKITRDKGAAEEVVEDVFVYVWQNIHQWQAQRGVLIAWLTMLCRSRALLYLRKPHAHKWDLFADISELACAHSVSSCDPYEWEITLFDAPLKKALEHLSEHEKQVLDAIYNLGLTHEETAQAIGLPLGTVKSHARRAIARLQQTLV